MSTYYDIFRVPEDADDKEIKAAYRQAALAYHPDQIPKGVSKRMRDDAAQTWLEIQEAFSVLSDPEKREEYDTLLEEMRQSEEAEQQFEPPTPPPPPPKPKPTPAPSPQQTTPQPTQQTQPTPRTKSKSAWLSFCYQMGRHWRKLCWITTAILYAVNGARDSENWSLIPTSAAVLSGIALIVILVASDVAWKNKGRYIVSAATVISLIVTGIFAASILSQGPAPQTVVTATSPASTVTTNNTPQKSAAPFADILKKHGFEAMPPACEKVPLNELDSCLVKVKSGFEKNYLKPAQEMENLYQKTQKLIEAPAVGNSWLTQLPEEYLFACFETDRSRCSTSITRLKYQPKQNVLLETEQFQDYFLDTDKKAKPSPGHWHATCPLHQRKDGHWIGECTYRLLWPEEGKPDDIACELTTSEEITEMTREGIVSGVSGVIDWTPRRDTLNPHCPEDSGTKKEFHLVPKQ